MVSQGGRPFLEAGERDQRDLPERQRGLVVGHRPEQAGVTVCGRVEPVLVRR